ncbi:MAG: hypothetical protein PHE88_02880 [Elusimicrobia bacterium]|nr:hypothetical protein [Elusimicrobiota bacterium]
MSKLTGFKIPVINMERAKNFLKKVFSWKVDGWAEKYFYVRSVKTKKIWSQSKMDR